MNKEKEKRTVSTKPLEPWRREIDRLDTELLHLLRREENRNGHQHGSRRV
jgi:hypothetical protein